MAWDCNSSDWIRSRPRLPGLGNGGFSLRRSNLVLPRCRTDLGPGRHTQFSAANCPLPPRAHQNQQTKENRTAESLNGLSGAIKIPSSMSVSFFPHFVSQLVSYPTSAVRFCAGASFCVCLPFPTPSPLRQSISECSYPVYHGKRPFGRLNPQPTPPSPPFTLRRGDSWVVTDLSCVVILLTSKALTSSLVRLHSTYTLMIACPPSVRWRRIIVAEPSLALLRTVDAARLHLRCIN
jgi:hypothetical protein